MASIIGDLDQGRLGPKQLEHSPFRTPGPPPAGSRQLDYIENLYSLRGH